MAVRRDLLRNRTLEIWLAGLDTLSPDEGHVHSGRWEIERMSEEEVRGA